MASINWDVQAGRGQLRKNTDWAGEVSVPLKQTAFQVGYLGACASRPSGLPSPKTLPTKPFTTPYNPLFNLETNP